MRLLFIALADSIHTARWINQLTFLDWNIHLFPAYECQPHRHLQGITVHRLIREPESTAHPSVQQTGLKWFTNRGFLRINNKLERTRLLSRSTRLARCVRKFKPDIIHVLEMQRAGYLFLDSSKLLTDYQLPPIIYSSWGSDLYHFGHQREHKRRVKEFLTLCDYFIADAKRDLALAPAYGFNGESLGVYPVAGGYDIEYMQQFRQPSIATRRLIMLKGYSGGDYGGRALVALEAIRLCASSLKNYELVIFSAGDEVCRAARNLNSEIGIEVRILPHVSHDAIISLMGKSRVVIGVGITDGTPNSMLEGMVMGAFPVQSDTVSTSEWITDGVNGLLVAPEDPRHIAAAIERATSDDKLVESAAKINQRLTRERIDRSVVIPEIVEIYRKVKNIGS